MQLLLSVVTLTVALTSSTSTPPSPPPVEQVDIYRDTYGVPYVFAVTDQGAYFGAGYAAAEDRLFQMCLARLRYQGRLSEFFGPGLTSPPGCPPGMKTNLRTDLKQRLSGLSREPAREAAALQVVDSTTYSLLEAYALGVNRAIADVNAGILTKHRLFTSGNWLPMPPAVWNIPIEPWTVADCIGVWNVLAGGYDIPMGHELAAAAILDFQSDPPPSPEEIAVLILGESRCDDQAAVIDEADAAPMMSQVDAYVAAHSLPIDPPMICPSGEFPHLSHAWVVHKSRTTNNKAVLVSEPRVGITIPSTFYEWRMTSSAGQMNVRGIGAPGSPNMLVGAAGKVAWGVTALGLDQADLFEVEVDLQNNTYELDGVDHPFEFMDLADTILIRDTTTGGFLTPFPAPYRECYWGPLVTDILCTTKQYALKAIPLSPGHGTASFDTDPISTTSAFRLMYHANNVDDFLDAIATWSVPSVGIVFADAWGDIGYQATGAHPVRAPGEFVAGFAPMNGRVSSSDWIDLLPNLCKPWVINPDSGYLVTANQSPAGSWYNLKHHWGGFGDNDRARRVRERLTALFPLPASKATSSAIAQIREDVVIPSTRDLVVLARHARDIQSPAFDFNGDADSALDTLLPWLTAGAKMDGSHAATTLASFLNSRIPINDPMTDVYGPGEHALTYMCKKRLIDMQQSGFALPTNECQFLERLLEQAWDCATGGGGTCPTNTVTPPPGSTIATWPAWYTDNVEKKLITPYMGLGPADPFTGPASPLGPVVSGEAATIVSSWGGCYPFWLQMGNLSSYKSRLALGESDRGPHATDQKSLWDDNELKGVTAGTPAGTPKQLTYP